MAQVNLKAEVEAIIEEITAKAVEEEEDKNAFLELKKASEYFLKNIEKISELKTHKSLMEQLISIKGKKALFYSNMRDIYDVSYTRRILELQHQYEKALNTFFGREIHLTYVTEDGTVLAFSDLATGKLYEMGTRNAGRANFNKAMIDSIIKYNSDMDEINKRLQQSAEKRREVYSEALKRWEFYENPKTGETEVKTEKEHGKYFHHFYWKQLGNSYGQSKKIGTKGLIAEAYAGAVINEDESLLGDLEGDNGTLSALNKLIEKDSIPASLKGDIVLKSNHNIQFAIKEGSFSSAMIGQYISIAYNITKINNINKTQLLAALPKLVKKSRVSEKIVNAINEKGINAINDILLVNLGSKSLNKKLDTLNNLKEIM